MKRKILAFVFVVCAAALIAVSCQNESEENRAVVTVSSINENAPFFSDVIEQGDTLYDPNNPGPPPSPYLWDDFVAEDYVAVTFYNRPYNNFTTTGPGDPLSDFLITRYRLEWRAAVGGTGTVPPLFEGATSVLVPSNTSVTAAVLLVPFTIKNDPAYTALQYTSTEFLMIAHITFWGHEVGTDREWSFDAELSVNFGDWIIETKKKQQQGQG
jgi:hypothetical protein